MDRVVFNEDWSGFDLGRFVEPVGADTEYHYLAGAAPRGAWMKIAFRGYGPDQIGWDAWWIREVAGRKCMAQISQQPDSIRHTHPMLMTGDEGWSDYTVRLEFTPEGKQGCAGIGVRCENSRRYVFFGLDGRGVVLKNVVDEKAFRVPDERVLARVDCDWDAGQTYQLVMECRGDLLKGRIEGLGSVEARDNTLSEGRLAILADRPTSFGAISVTTTEAASVELNRRVSEREAELAALRARNPRMKLWKKVETPGFGVGRNLRFGDLDGDGRMEFVIGQMKRHGPGDKYCELSCLTAMNFDGDILWQLGKPDPDHWKVTNDVAFQIHDIDGDGRCEVIFTMNQELIVADGSTGKTKFKAPTPRSRPPADAFPRILGDCLFFCDLSGKGRKSDLIIKDRYWHFWALDEKLNPLWEGQCNTGHFPTAHDIDGDGRDELAIGYSLYDHDGTQLWSLDATLDDHMDGVAIVDMGGGDGLTIVYAASDEGIVFVDLEGTIRKHHRVGHAQNPTFANLRPDRDGLEMVCINFWGNQGILHFLDSRGAIYKRANPNPFGSMCLPVNWTGEPGEYFVHNPNVKWGGLFDGYGRKVVEFPDDGHPDMCNAVLDVTGDVRDEIVVWDTERLWVYTQDDNPKDGPLYQVARNPQFNQSNYQANVSLPVPNPT